MISVQARDPRHFDFLKGYVSYDTDILFDYCLSPERAAIAKAQYCGGNDLVTRAYSTVDDRFVYCCEDAATGVVYKQVLYADADTLTEDEEKSILTCLCRGYWDNCVERDPSMMDNSVGRCILGAMMLPVYLGVLACDRFRRWRRGDTLDNAVTNFDSYMADMQRLRTFQFVWDQEKGGFHVKDLHSDFYLTQTISLTPRPTMYIIRNPEPSRPTISSALSFDVADRSVVAVEYLLQQEFHRLVRQQPFDAPEYCSRLQKALK